MPTNKPRFTVTMSDEMLQQIDDFKFANRYKTQNQAVIALVRRGIEELERQDADKKMRPPAPMFRSWRSASPTEWSSCKAPWSAPGSFPPAKT